MLSPLFNSHDQSSNELFVSLGICGLLTFSHFYFCWKIDQPNGTKLNRGVPWEEEIQICTVKLILDGEGLVRGLKMGNWLNVSKFSSGEPRIEIPQCLLCSIIVICI